MCKSKLIRTAVLFVFYIFSVQYVSAQKIEGHIYAKETGEPLSGAKVSLEHEEHHYKTTASLDGSFKFSQIEKKHYKIEVSYTGYKTYKSEVDFTDGKPYNIPSIYLEPSDKDLNEVLITSNIGKSSDKYNRKLEKVSPFVMNTLSQRAIELSPDVTVANSLQRMSGVTIQRSNSGEGRYAIIRGMDQRYNTTLVNGIKIPSPDDRFRYVPMDLFPSDMLERLEVIKALTPSMEADAVGGVMNLIMKNAPRKEEIKGFVAFGGNTLFNNSRPFQSFNHSVINSQSPAERNGANYFATSADFPTKNLDLFKKAPFNIQSGLTYGNRFFHKKLGLMLGLSYQNQFRGSDQILNIQYPGATVLTPAKTGYATYTDNYPQFKSATERHYSTQNRRIGINNKWDYEINNKNKISLYNFYVRMDEYQARTSADTDVNTNLLQLAKYIRTRWQIQEIYNSTLKGEHAVTNHFSIDWIAAYSIAKQRIPGFAQYEVDYKKDTTGLPPAFVQVNDKWNVWNRNNDKDLAGYLNMHYTDLFGKKLNLSWGGMLRHKTRDNVYIKYNMSPDPKGQAFNGIDSATYSFSANNQAAALGTFGTGRNYNITEDVSAGYGQFTYLPSEKWQVLGGIRIEHTNQKYTTNLPSDVNTKNGHIYYTDFLPSLHIKYLINEKQNIWLSYFRSLVRPSFAEIIPQSIPSEENDLGYDIQGNPYVKHTTADNYDIRYGCFPKGSDQLLIGGFFKRIHNPIEMTFSHYNIYGGSSSPGTNILTPTNIGDVNNLGVELQYTKYIGNFGISLNYTYTHSATTTTKYYLLSRKAIGLQDTTIAKNQTRPMAGQAKHIGNAAFIYKNENLGLDAQIAYVYTGERIALVNTFYNMDTWQSPYGQMDFSFEKKLFKRLSIYGKVHNLTNSKTRYFIKMPYLIGNTLNTIPAQDKPATSIFVQQDIYKISYLFGVRFKL